MAATWEHQELGQFTYDVDGWRKRIEAPGFDAFSCDFGDPEEGGPNGTYDLHFHAESENDVPSEAAVAVARKVLSDPAAVVRRVSEALWEDLNGRGPGSGMWWHDGLEQVAEVLDEEEISPPDGPEAVRGLLQLSQIFVYPAGDRFDRACVELALDAPFEEEHGVSVLTDGEAVVGIGYRHSVAPFGHGALPGDEAEAE